MLEFDKEYRVELRVKNNLLYKKIYDNYGTIKNFSDTAGISIQVIRDFLNFKCDLYNRRGGELKNSVKKLMDIFKCPLNELFPENYKVIETNKYVKEVSQQEIELISMQSSEMNLLTYSFDSEIEQIDLRNKIEKLINTLSPREAEIIRLKYFNNYTITEIAEELGIFKQRVGQIIEAAIGKMSHPGRIKSLKEYAEGRDILTSLNAYNPNRLAKIKDKDETTLFILTNTIWKDILGVRRRLYIRYCPIQIDQETISRGFIKKYKGKYIKFIYDEDRADSLEDLKLFRKLINIFIDLCKSVSDVKITDKYIIMPRSEFEKLNSKVLEVKNIINVNID